MLRGELALSTDVSASSSSQHRGSFFAKGDVAAVQARQDAQRTAALGKRAGGALVQRMRGNVAFHRILKTIKTQRHPLAERASVALMARVHELRGEPSELIPCSARHALVRACSTTGTGSPGSSAGEAEHLGHHQRRRATQPASRRHTKKPTRTTGWKQRRAKRARPASQQARRPPSQPARRQKAPRTTAQTIQSLRGAQGPRFTLLLRMPFGFSSQIALPLGMLF